MITFIYYNNLFALNTLHRILISNVPCLNYDTHDNKHKQSHSNTHIPHYRQGNSIPKLTDPNFTGFECSDCTNRYSRNCQPQDITRQ